MNDPAVELGRRGGHWVTQIALCRVRLLHGAVMVASFRL